MIVTEKDLNEKYINVWSTKKVKEIQDKEDKGIKLKQHEKIWFDNKSGIRKANLKFAPTKKEIEEFTKCKLDIHYFANHFCQIKREDGTIGPMKLRDYQSEIIDLFKNKRSILMASRQTGKTISAAITILHFALFNKDKGIMIVANKGGTVVEIIEKIKSIYKLLPFFLKRGVVNWNLSSITFDNNCRIKTDKRSKEPAIGFTIDLLYLDEFAHIPANIINPYYTAVIPILSSVDNSRLIITSTPKGLNLFHTLLAGSELEEDDTNWNGFRSTRVYWWQIKGRRDTKLYLMQRNLNKFHLTKGEVLDFLKENELEVYEKKEDGEKVIFMKHDKHDEKTHFESIARLRINGDVPLGELGRLTNWEKQETKLIGGEDGFKQEYDLHFLSGNKMLFESTIIEEIYEGQMKMDYVNIPKFNEMLKIDYHGLQFVKNQPTLFDLAEAKNYHIYMGVDLSEGLGEDYSVINIFRLMPKTPEEIKKNKHKFSNINDYFKLEQIGIYKTNIYSVEDVSYILYMLAFELFNSDKTRIALERNTYGDALLAHMPNVFQQENDYSQHVFLRYKNRQEEKTTKMGIRVNRNKKLLIKDYQVNTKKGNIILRDKYTIQEVTTFTKQDTPSGDITFKSESGHDDAIMTCVVLSSAFGHIAYRDSVEALMEELGGDLSKIIQETKTKYDDDVPDLTSFAGGFNKVYKKPQAQQKPMPQRNAFGGSTSSSGMDNGRGGWDNPFKRF